jgi:hypothetical protein
MFVVVGVALVGAVAWSSFPDRKAAEEIAQATFSEEFRSRLLRDDMFEKQLLSGSRQYWIAARKARRTEAWVYVGISPMDLSFTSSTILPSCIGPARDATIQEFGEVCEQGSR